MTAHLVALLGRMSSTLRALARWTVDDVRAAEREASRALEDSAERLRTGRGGKRSTRDAERREE